MRNRGNVASGGLALGIGLLGACGVGGGEGQQVGASTEALTQSAAESANAVVPLVAPLASGAAETQDAAGGDGAGGGDAETRSAIEAPFDGTSCVGFAWAGTAAEITFDECVLPETGTTVDGGLALGVTLQPTQLRVGFAALHVDDASIDGSLALSLGEGALGLDVDVTTVRSGGSPAHLVLDGATVAHTPETTTLDGAGTVEKNGTSADVSFAAVQWVRGDCLPSSGWIRAETSGSPPVTITFLATTPEDGVVSVQVGNLPAVEQALLPACR